jgi:hypothetical protein
MQKNNWEQMYLDGIFSFFLYLRGFVAAMHLQMRKYKKDLTTLDYLLSKISSKIDISHLNQRPMMDLTMAPHHRSPLEPPDLQVKAALMEAEGEAVTDRDGNMGGGGGGNSNSYSGGGQQQRGQATINNMRRRLAAVVMVVGGGSGEKRRTKTTMAAAIAVAMVEEAVVVTAATVATVAEATATETERQNSGVGILSLANVICSTVLLGKQWQYFGIFFSICMRKQIICETDTDTHICIF